MRAETDAWRVWAAAATKERRGGDGVEVDDEGEARRLAQAIVAAARAAP
jgi:hypothetical protein